jgi:hypothetical protein
MEPPSYGRVGDVQLPDPYHWRASHLDLSHPVANLRKALVWTWPDVVKRTLSTGRFM